MKRTLTSLSIIVFTVSLLLILPACNDNHSQSMESKPKQDTVAYNFTVPDKWTVETIPFPIDFAPDINYTGVEVLRFTPGWGPTTSSEHWAYTFLWWLDGEQQISDTILQQHLTTYYTGLVGRNIRKNSIPANRITPVSAVITKAATRANDESTYSGKITMTDYLDLVVFKPITLNCIIHVKKCTGHSALIFQVSPKPYNDSIWKTFATMSNDFTCR